MPIQFKEYIQAQVHQGELGQVKEIAYRLHSALNLPEVQQAIALANQPGQSSSFVQNTFLEFATHLGFQSEARGLFQNSFTAGLRPDYYLPIGNTGILLEVERGKTTMNNMDLLDFWKCHICESANYLFLLVPQELRQSTAVNATVRYEFANVDRRLSPFFQSGNYTNVLGLFLYGY
jgi:hypothetical protein